ncbi:MAG: serine/threonine-protein phosphatase, partial [Bacteroidetes bacterium]|nr:serine/threonine-protein phosphatase [Bacteroidota bacterium]
EVGGDYYDTYKENEHTYVLIIGDVSGKGTSAAFHMAQMKGVFQSLIQLEMPPASFMEKANAALSKCLEKNHFITASIFRIDCEKKEFTHARAGHIPTLMYKAKEKKSAFLEIDGLGLGILRNHTYKNHVYEKTYSFAPGDILVMLTDGILEGKNQHGEQFGYERIKNLVEVHHHKSTEDIQQLLILALHDFVGGDGIIDDDYSLLLVKFS